MQVKENILLKDFTSFKIGGPARYFLSVNNVEELIWAINFAKEKKINYFVIGGGSNLLVADKGYNGLVIKLQMHNFNIKGNTVFAESGVLLSKLVVASLNANLKGLDWAAGIPGTLGGAVFGNAQAFGRRVSDNIVEVECLDTKSLKIKKFSKKQCNFTLKNSIFKKYSKTNKLIILSATFILEKGEKEEIKKNILEYVSYRKKNHPINFPSAGSVFVNPEKKITNKKLLEKFPELKYFNNKGAIPAGYLIEKTGLLGKTIGGAKFSDIHANFIVNTGNAKAKDVLQLMNLAKTKVKKIFNINLETEIRIIR